MNTLLPDSSFRFKIPLLYLLCLATASLDLEPDLISMEKIYARGWYNFILCDITVSDGRHNCFRCDLAFFRVDSYNHYICDITWKLIQKCYIIHIHVYHMASRVTYQNRWHNAPGLSCHLGADILVCHPRSHVIYV